MPRFQPGASGNPQGRPPGPNKTTVEMRGLAQRLVGSRSYRKQLRERLIAGTLPPLLERELWHYAYGKPVEHLAVSGPTGLPLRVMFGGRYLTTGELEEPEPMVIHLTSDDEGNEP